MLASTVKSLSNNDAAKEMIKWLQEMKKKAKSLWQSSKYFRVISIATGSITISWIARNIYLKYYRKYYNMPPGPYGIPFIGQSMAVAHFGGALQLGRDKCLISICLGPTMDAICINNPYLIKKIYSDSRTLDNWPFVKTDVVFGFVNGEQWAKRRKIIYSNLMSTMKASFVEDATKEFIKNKVFNVFDDKIQKKEMIQLKPLFRPLGFNLILHACFGQELETLDDPFWLNFDKLLRTMGSNAFLQNIMLTLFGEENKFTSFLERSLGIETFDDIFQKLAEITEEFASNEKHNVKRDENDKYNKDIKLFNDYIGEYTLNNDNTLTKRHLFGDMAMMFLAATDTTYAALGYALLMAAKYPLIQEELHKELIDAFDNDINNITLRKGGILKISKLRAFVHEILRIHPPLPMAGFRKMNAKDFIIDMKDCGDNGIYNIPKGCMMMMNIMAVHHNPKWWIKDYDPENNEQHRNIDMNEIHLEFWLDSDGKFNKIRNSLSFLPFIRGKRDCVGQSLAMKEIYIVLAMIFMMYKVYGPNGDSNIDIKGSLSLVMEPSPDTVTLKLR